MMEDLSDIRGTSSLALTRDDIRLLAELVESTWEAYSEGSLEGQARHDALADKLGAALALAGEGDLYQVNPEMRRLVAGRRLSSIEVMDLTID